MRRALALGLLLGGGLLLSGGLPAWAAPAWGPALTARLATLEAAFAGELGLHVRETGGGERFGWRDTEPWYLASLVKVPVAVELLARVEAGELALDERLMLHERDYVDGAGPTNWAEPGTALRLDELLEAMLTVSDNTATDLLIGRLGLAAVNRRAAALAGPEGLGPITTLLEVRRQVYGRLHPAARDLTGFDFIELQKRDDEASRLAWLAARLGVPRHALRLPSLAAAFDAYYASGLNGGRLDAYGELLAAIGEGRALGAAATGELLAIMAATTSGEARLRAGFGPGVRFAHKTGTQHRLACDAGLVLPHAPSVPRLVVVACVRGEADVNHSEQALAEIGRALRELGLVEPAP